MKRPDPEDRHRLLPLIPRSWGPSILAIVGILSSLGLWVTTQVIALDDRLDRLETAAAKLIDAQTGRPAPSTETLQLRVEVQAI